MVFLLLVLGLLVLGLLVLAWTRIESRHASTSSGFASIVLGCALFGFGLVNLSPSDKLFIWFLIVVGVIMALFGLARLMGSMARGRV